MSLPTPRLLSLALASALTLHFAPAFAQNPPAPQPAPQDREQDNLLDK
ncbi:MAG TPA: hypothetical protein VIG68_07320 [Lysobacter sp.]